VIPEFLYISFNCIYGRPEDEADRDGYRLGWLLSCISGFACYASESIPAVNRQTAMLDTWTTQSPSGKTVTFTIKGRKELGFEYSAEAAGGKIVKVRIRRKILTRAEIEKFCGIYREKLSGQSGRHAMRSPI
jgi:hypothetical protein